MREKIEVKDSGIKVGDILVGTSGWNRTITTWYKVVRTTKCKVVLDELPTSYPTEYGSNTPGSICMPVVDGVIDKSCPFVFNYRTEKGVSAFVYKTGYGIKVKLPGDYGASLHPWDGAPGWVNCD